MIDTGPSSLWNAGLGHRSVRVEKVLDCIGDFVLSAKYGEKYFPRRPPNLPIHEEKGYWWSDLSDEVRVSFDGFALNEMDLEDRDVETFIIFFCPTGSGHIPSFFVSLNGCQETKASVDRQHLCERYELDVEEQLDGSKMTRTKFEEWVIGVHRSWKKKLRFINKATSE